MSKKSGLLLAGDIGGTKTIVALYDRTQGPRRPVAEETFPSTQFESLAEIVRVFLAGKKAPLSGAVFGVSGPVVAKRARVTNLPWVADAQELGSMLGVPVGLLNDLESIGHAVPFLSGEDLETLNKGEAEPHGTLAVFAPGTGLGEGFLVWDGKGYRPAPSEGGHTDFGPTTPLELELLAYWQKRLDHVSYERVCSGLGIPNLYRFLKDSGRFSEPAWLAEQLAGAADQTPIIAQTALAGKSDLCSATLDLFVSIAGAEAGNLALKVLATGGVYVGGGIPPRILPKLKEGGFMEAFKRKGRFAALMSRLPVHVIMRKNAALFGAACAGLDVTSS